MRLRLIFEGFDVTNRANFATVQNKLHWAISGKTAAEMLAVVGLDDPSDQAADREHLGATLDVDRLQQLLVEKAQIVAAVELGRRTLTRAPRRLVPSKT